MNMPLIPSDSHAQILQRGFGQKWCCRCLDYAPSKGGSPRGNSWFCEKHKGKGEKA